MIPHLDTYIASICTKVSFFNFFLTALIRAFKFFIGIQEKREGISATVYPVHKLTECEDYHGIGHICHTDNWYTSMETCELGLDRKIDFIGTCKINRKGLPREVRLELGNNLKGQ